MNWKGKNDQRNKQKEYYGDWSNDPIVDTALLEVESSSPSADMASHYHIQPWVQEIICPVRAWTSTGQMWVKKLTHIKK